MVKIAPGFHEYVMAPEAVKVVVPPTQIPAGEAVAVIVGRGLTVIVMVLVPEQLPVTPFTV